MKSVFQSVNPLSEVLLLAGVIWLAAAFCHVEATENVDYSSVQDHLEALRKVEAETFDRLSEDHFSSVDREDRIESEYGSLFGGYDLGKLAGSDNVAALDDFFEATMIMAVFKPTDEYVGTLEDTYAALQNRGAVEPEHTRQLFNAYVAAREFGKAEKFAVDSQSLSNDVPEIRRLDSKRGLGDQATGGRYRIYLYRDGANTLVERQLSNRELRQSIIVIAHPLCGFTRSAIEGLYGEFVRPDDSDAVEFLWLIPPPGGLQMGPVAALQKEYPGLEFGLIGSLDGWEEIEELGTPTFYSIDPGNATDVVVGWTGDESKERVRELVLRQSNRSAH